MQSHFGGRYSYENRDVKWGAGWIASWANKYGAIFFLTHNTQLAYGDPVQAFS